MIPMRYFFVILRRKRNYIIHKYNNIMEYQERNKEIPQLGIRNTKTA